ARRAHDRRRPGVRNRLPLLGVPGRDRLRAPRRDPARAADRPLRNAGPAEGLMADTPHTPQVTPPVEAGGPQIGADEWVARSDERRRAGVLGRARLSAERLPAPVQVAALAAVVALVALVPVMTTDDYILRVGVVSLIFALPAL